MLLSILLPRLPLALLCAAVAMLAGCSSFQSQVKHAQAGIEESFKNIGYTPRDAIEYRSTPREMKDRQWVERTVRFRDRQDRTWPELHQYFRNTAQYDFDYYLTVGESESDLEKIRWFEFKIDQVYCVYRVEFVRSRLAGMSLEQPLLQQVPQTESRRAP